MTEGFRPSQVRASLERSREEATGRVFFFLKRTGNRLVPAVQQELLVDASLKAPQIKIDLADPLHPIVSVPRKMAPDGTPALYYFEFDTSSNFDSPNFWRYPALLPSTFVRVAFPG